LTQGQRGGMIKTDQRMTLWPPRVIGLKTFRIPHEDRTMIQDVEILNFKCFKSLYLPELSRINLIGGMNNVGKTALLEALFILHDRTDPQMFLKTLGWRGVPTVPADPASVWGPFCHQLDLQCSVQIKVKTEGGPAIAQYRFDPAYTPVSFPEATTDAEGQAPEHIATSNESRACPSIDIVYGSPGGHETRQHLYLLDGKPRIDYEQQPKPVPPAMILVAQHRESPEKEANLLSRLIENKNEAVVEEFLGVIHRVKDLQVVYVGQKPTIMCDIELPRMVPLGYVGNGMTRLLTIILGITAVEGGLILIDEVENGIHPSVQERFWWAIGEAARKFKCQVIAATHSYEFLRNAHVGLRGLFEPEFRYIRLERDGPETRAKTFNYEMLGSALEANLEVR